MCIRDSTSWQHMASERELSQGVADLAPKVEEQIGASQEMAAELTSVVAGLRKLADARLEDGDAALVADIRRLAAEVATGK